MRKATLAAAALTMALTAPPALAQQPAGDSIVVTAPIENEIADFVGALSAVPGRDQIGRFERSICPAVAGVPAAQKAAIVQRMRAVAKAVGIATGKADCTPNVLLIATAERKALIERFARLYPGSMADLSRSQRRAIVESDEPAVAWHVKGPQLDRNGRELQQTADGVTINRTAGMAGRLQAMARPQFAAAVVVVDSAELVGLTTTQLADYGAMRAFLETEPAHLDGTSVPTILRILHARDDEEVPLSLTEQDLEALKAFYRVDPTLTAAAQRSQVGQQVQGAASAD